MLTRRRLLVQVAAAALPVAAVRAPARAAQFVYKLATDVATEHPVTVGALELAAAVKRETGGRLEFQVFPNNVLGGDTSMMQQVRIGSIHLNVASGDILSSVVPACGIERLGFAWPSNRAALSAMVGDLGNYIRGELKAKGLVALNGFWENGFREITTSTRPIRVADDLAGLKIRVPAAAIAADLFRVFGASPVSIEGSEMYTALQTHVADAMEGSFANLYSFKIYEVQKYLSVTNHQWNGYWSIMNPDAWNALPPDIQAIVQRNAAAASAKASRNAELQAGTYAAKLKDLGMIANTADASTFKARLGSYYAHWKTEFGATAWSLLEKYVGKVG